MTWPLIWPVTVLCLTIQLILQLKIFDQVYLFAAGGRTAATMVLVQYIYEQAFQRNSGGYAATIAVALFLIVIVFSVLHTNCFASGGRDDERRAASARRTRQPPRWHWDLAGAARRCDCSPRRSGFSRSIGRS